MPTDNNNNNAGESSFCSGKIRRWEIAVFVVALLVAPALGVIVADQLHRTRVSSIEDMTDNTLLNVVRSVNTDFSLVIGVTRSLAMLFFSGLNSSVIPNPSLPPAQQQIALIHTQFGIFAAEEIRRSPSIYSFQSRPGNIITQILPNGTAPYGLNLNIFSPEEVASAMRARDGFIAGPRTLRQGFPGLVTSWPLWLRTTDAGSVNAVRSEYFGTVGIVVNLTRFVERINIAGTIASARGLYDGLFVDNFQIAYHMKNTATGNETWFGSPEIAALSTVRSASTTVSGVQSTVYISAEASTASPTEIGAGVGVSVGTLLLLVVAYVLYTNWRSMKENERDLSNAPTGADGKPFVIIFTDIEKSTLLWSTVPLSMQAALDTSFGIITRLVENRNLYIVKTIGDSIMLAVNDPNVAAALMADIQREHQRALWPACIDHVYMHRTEDELLDIVDEPEELSSPASSVEEKLCRGLRIRIGAAHGTPKAVFDNVTKSIDYFGATTNLASRVESAARGGQILVSGELGDAINCAAINCTLTVAGEFTLKGFPNQVPLFELCPKELVPRMLAAAVNDAGDSYSSQRFPNIGRENSDAKGEGQSFSDLGAPSDVLMADREREDLAFFRTLFTTCKPHDTTMILEVLGGNWRCNGANADEERMSKIAHRVSRVKAIALEKEARRVNRKARLELSGGSSVLENLKHKRKQPDAVHVGTPGSMTLGVEDVPESFCNTDAGVHVPKE